MKRRGIASGQGEDTGPAAAQADRLRELPARSAAGLAEETVRRQRLAAALRENLRKRKAQVAARGEVVAETGALAVKPGSKGPRRQP